MQSHLIFDALLPAFGRQTKVAWSMRPSRGVVVFVHGFNGAAIRSWADFPVLIRERAEFANWDVIFFGYDGQNTEVASSSADLRSLLDATERPDTLYQSSEALPQARRKHPSSYDRIVLVAHSLGSIISRRAMLDGYNESIPATWSPKVELFNFAPAHGGAKLLSLLSETIGLLDLAVSVAQFANKFIVLRDLKVGSPTVTRLESDTRAAVLAGRGNLRAIDTVWARNDKVVTNGPFALDPPPRPSNVVSGKTHTSVCKPAEKSYELPVNSVAKHLV